MIKITKLREREKSYAMIVIVPIDLSVSESLHTQSTKVPYFFLVRTLYEIDAI